MEFTLSKETFLQRLRDAMPGDKIAYHVGSLMADRVSKKEFTAAANARAEKVDEVAKAAWKAADMVWDKNMSPEGQYRCNGNAQCALTQRRLSDPLGFEYIAVKL